VTPLSAVIIARNEERKLPAALASVSFCDEVLVVDADSSDRTREIAAELGARVVLHAPWPGFAAQREFAARAAQHDWVLAVDADERVPEALRAEILAARAAGFPHDAYRMPRVAFYMGRWIRGTDWYPDPQVRLFDRRKGHWGTLLIHESLQVDGSIGRLCTPLEHVPYDDVSTHMRKIDDYTTLWARQAFAQGRRASFAGLALRPPWAFFRNYVLRGGLRLGAAGLAVSLFNAYYTALKIAKLAELSEPDASA
jgi:glycosyltransferase involved in cell wall biosynthesis